MHLTQNLSQLSNGFLINIMVNISDRVSKACVHPFSWFSRMFHVSASLFYVSRFQAWRPCTTHYHISLWKLVLSLQWYHVSQVVSSFCFSLLSQCWTMEPCAPLAQTDIVLYSYTPFVLRLTLLRQWDHAPHLKRRLLGQVSLCLVMSYLIFLFHLSYFYLMFVFAFNPLYIVPLGCTELNNKGIQKKNWTWGAYLLSEMCNKCDSIFEISLEKKTWTIMAKVIRLWLVADFTKQKIPFSMKLVLMD